MKNTSFAFLIILTIFSINLNAQNTTIEKPKICSTPPEGHLLGGKISLGPPISCLGVSSDSILVSISNSSDPDIGGKLLNPLIYFNVNDNFDISASKSVSLINNSISAYFPFGKNWIMMVGEFKGKKYLTCALQENLRTKDPDYSATLCNDNKLTIKIPESKNNTYDRYTINWGNGEKEEIYVSSNQLPIVKSKNIVDNQTVTIQGVYVRNGSKVCISPFIPLIPNQKNLITGLEFSNDGSSALINISGNLNNESIDILGKIDNNSQEDKWLKMGSVTNSLGTIPNLYPEKNYCFKTMKINNCGVEEYSFNKICDLNLKITNINNSKPTLGWNLSKNQADTHTKIIITKNIENCTNCEVNIPLNKIDSIYRDNSAECSKIYNYRVTSIINTIDDFNRSQEMKIYSKWLKVDNNKDYKNYSPNNIAIVGFDPLQESKVNINIAVFNEGGILKYHFFKADKDGQKFNQIGASNINTFADTIKIGDLNPLCYKFKIEDNCGKITDFSDEFCTIQLSLGRQQFLNWTPYELPMSSIIGSTKVDYSVEYFNPSLKAYVPISTTNELYFDASNFISKSTANELIFRVSSRQYIDISNVYKNQFISSFSNVLKYNIVTGIEPQNGIKNISIYPNPTKDKFLIETNKALDGDLEIALISQDGKVLINKRITEKEFSSGKFEFDLKNINLKPGLHFIRATSGSWSKTEKLIIE